MMKSTVRNGLGAALIAALLAAPPPVRAEEPDARPLSPAQVALFETPHLRNVTSTGSLQYRFTQEGGITDQVALRVLGINPDGTKQLGFEYLTGDRRVFYPPVEHFAGNPLLMLFLDQDVKAMKEQLGLSTSYFRNRIRQALVDGAAVTEGSFVLDGRSVPARHITLHPFADDQRLERLPTVQAKTYSFVLADEVPGMIAEIRTSLPADPKLGIPPTGERLTYVGTAP